MPLRARPFLLLLALHAPYAVARTCALSIGADDQMQFSTAELRVAPDCTRVELTLRHTGTRSVTAMGHNWVLAKTADMEAVEKDGIAAGAANNYVKSGDPRVIAATKLVGGGESATASFDVAKLKAGDAYSFFCSFPGHYSLMKGSLALVD